MKKNEEIIKKIELSLKNEIELIIKNIDKNINVLEIDIDLKNIIYKKNEEVILDKKINNNFFDLFKFKIKLDNISIKSKKELEKNKIFNLAKIKYCNLNITKNIINDLIEDLEIYKKKYTIDFSISTNICKIINYEKNPNIKLIAEVDIADFDKLNHILNEIKDKYNIDMFYSGNPVIFKSKLKLFMSEDELNYLNNIQKEVIMFSDIKNSCILNKIKNYIIKSSNFNETEGFVLH